MNNYAQEESEYYRALAVKEQLQAADALAKAILTLYRLPEGEDTYKEWGLVLETLDLYEKVRGIK